MCEACGCSKRGDGSTAAHSHDHAPLFPLSPPSPPPKPSADGLVAQQPASSAPRHHSQRIDLEARLLAANDAIAEANRRRFQREGIVVLNLISAPGSGKTTLLECTLDALRGRVPCGVITGDQETDRDARRLSGRGACVVQIQTHGVCHLDAPMVQSVLPTVLQGHPRLLFIENVGNLVCPAAFDLGETAKVALLSVAEGDDKPLKYPQLFLRAGAVLITKTDLLPHVAFDVTACRKHLKRMHPDSSILELSAKTGEGLDAWVRYLEQFLTGSVRQGKRSTSHRRNASGLGRRHAGS